jgi:hypothetical protein
MFMSGCFSIFLYMRQFVLIPRQIRPPLLRAPRRRTLLEKKINIYLGWIGYRRRPRAEGSVAVRFLVRVSFRGGQTLRPPVIRRAGSMSPPQPMAVPAIIPHKLHSIAPVESLLCLSDRVFSATSSAESVKGVIARWNE